MVDGIEDGDASRWDQFIRFARLFHEWEGFDAAERDYKLRLASRLAEARATVEQGNATWPDNSLL